MPPSTTASPKKKKVVKKKGAGPTTKKPKGTNLSNVAPTRNTPPRKANGPSRTMILIWFLVLAEVVMDLVTTVISFIAAASEFDCCGESVNFRGGLVLGFTIPFFFLILLEAGVLAASIKHSLFDGGDDESESGGSSHPFAFLGSTRRQRMINGLLLLNPFFGFLMAWMLLYQSDRQSCLVVLSLEVVSLLLHYISIKLEGLPQTRLSILIYSLPLIPFVITVILISLYLRRGGVCYLADDEMFWYEGCKVCSGSTLPDEDTGVCADGTDPYFGSYCSNELSFCWFEYS